MQARKPDFIMINSRSVKVQQWQILPDRVLLTVLVRGDAAGTDLLAELGAETVTVAWADSPARQVKPEITHHRATTTGPATVHRIEATLWLAAAPRTDADDTVEAKLNRILQELHALRAEVAELRGPRRPGPGSMAAPLASGHTLLDFEIDENE